ncbi:hypothetical protein GO755_22750 [Spirosoma sp. HMF4905]|uniref:Photosynthesis system II assembly factor Ycf48/Hcf136-like domain-containing protein n=1 Tax=Spirosoma arboris TaxID=2682092 RepID=A0A7K1SGD2_9BACT|nr:hypothetical protein [Spirosoma arboris]MVM32877.1 hypothetical protein [Spirosoma arboris]
MKFYSIILISLGIFATACHKQTEELVVPRPTWKLRSDIFLDNKVLLGVHATDKRLVIATTNAFFQMGAADTSFIKYNSNGGGTLYSLGPQLYSRSLIPPIFSNTLYVTTSSDRTLMGFANIYNIVDSTYHLEGSSVVNIAAQTRIANAQLDVREINSVSNPVFGAYNESTKALLYQVVDPANQNYYGARHVMLMQNRSTSSNFVHYGIKDDFYSDSVAAAFPISGMIAVKDYFIASPISSIYGANGFIYAINARLPQTKASIQKIPITINTPDNYFFYKDHLYGYVSTSGELARSDDGGFTWRKLGQTSPSLRFSVVNGNLIGYAFAQVFWLDNGSETFSNIRELTNDGLEFSQIMGVAAFNNKVFAATLSGLYAIDADGFFTVKQK